MLCLEAGALIFGAQESRRRGGLLHLLGRFLVLFLRTLNTAGSSVAFGLVHFRLFPILLRVRVLSDTFQLLDVLEAL